MSEFSPIISICITQYNEDINPLLNHLCTEIDSSLLPINIYIGDDYSSDIYPIKIPKSYIFYNRNDENLGRAMNRNTLAQKAEGEYILFLDGDIVPSKESFLQDYLRFIKETQASVCSGGISYARKVPHKKKLLHYRYGLYRESVVDENSALKTSNLLIRRKLIADITFDESLITYGHEDTFLSYRLKEKGIPIHFITNPVLHQGILTNEEFLNRQEQAVRTLAKLHHSGYEDITRLQRTYQRAHDSLYFRALAGNRSQRLMHWILTHFPHVNLKVLDIYKLFLFHRILTEKRKI